MKNYRCLKCYEDVVITSKIVSREWAVRGYDYEGWEYYISCPKCSAHVQVKFSELPFKIKWQIISGKLKNDR